jgi:hypothetical protein
VFNVGIIRITFKLLFVKRKKNSFLILFQIFGIFFGCLHFSVNLHYVFHFFPTRIAKGTKFETKKTCWILKVGGEWTQISPNCFTFTFTKEQKCKLKFIYH